MKKKQKSIQGIQEVLMVPCPCRDRPMTVHVGIYGNITGGFFQMEREVRATEDRLCGMCRYECTVSGFVIFRASREISLESSGKGEIIEISFPCPMCQESFIVQMEKHGKEGDYTFQVYQKGMLVAEKLCSHCRYRFYLSGNMYLRCRKRKQNIPE